MKPWLLPTIGVFFCWGLWGFLPKVTTRYISPSSAIVYEVMGGFLVAIATLIYLNFKLETNPMGIALGVANGVVGFVGALLFLVAASRGSVALVVTVSALYPVASILLASWFLQEAITLRQAFGVGLAILAMVLVAA